MELSPHLASLSPATYKLALDYLDLIHSGRKVSVDQYLSAHPGAEPGARALLETTSSASPSEARRALRSQLSRTTPQAGARTPASGSPAATVVANKSPSDTTRIHAMFDRRYRILQHLGQGGFGNVYLVEDLHQEDLQLALKVILPAHTRTSEREQRFRNEIRILRSLNHPRMPQIFNDGKTDAGEIYYTMTYVEGKTLSALLDEGTVFPPARCVPLLVQVLELLVYAHSKGIVHRDLKPSNILVVKEGTPVEGVCVLDFGIAKVLALDTPLLAKVIGQTVGPIGTPLYMSPEQLIGQPVGESSDLYSLGLIAHAMLYGRLPSAGVPLERSLRPRWLRDWIARCFSPDPRQRPTARQSLDLFLSQSAARLRRRRSGAAAAFGACALAIGGWLAWQQRPVEGKVAMVPDPSPPEPGPAPSPEPPIDDRELPAPAPEPAVPTTATPASDWEPILEGPWLKALGDQSPAANLAAWMRAPFLAQLHRPEPPAAVQQHEPGPPQSEVVAQNPPANPKLPGDRPPGPGAVPPVATSHVDGPATRPEEPGVVPDVAAGTETTPGATGVSDSAPSEPVPPAEPTSRARRGPVEQDPEAQRLYLRAFEATWRLPAGFEWKLDPASPTGTAATAMLVWRADAGPSSAREMALVAPGILEGELDAGFRANPAVAPWTTPPFLIDRHEFAEPESLAPLTGVAFEDALARAKALGLDLPTREEWRLAATWTGLAFQRYSWGSEFAVHYADEARRQRPSRLRELTLDQSPFGIWGMGSGLGEWCRESAARSGAGWLCGPSLYRDPARGVPFDRYCERTGRALVEATYTVNDPAAAAGASFKCKPAAGVSDLSRAGFRCILRLERAP